MFEPLFWPPQRAKFGSQLSGNEFGGIFLWHAPFEEGLEIFGWGTTNSGF